MPYTTRIAVIGDSVAWGQGLQEPHKFYSLVAARYGTPEQVELCVPAHSGAVINTAASGMAGVSPEVPEAIPTMLDQVDAISDPATIDLVLLNGGINDVSLPVLLNPLTSKADLHAATVNACLGGMKMLIDKAANTFTKATCKFVVTGYYPILSPDSDPLAVSDDALIHLLGIYNNGIPAIFSKEEQAPIVDTIVALCMQFWSDSDSLLGQAVLASASKSKLGNRLMFVPNTFTAENALFADKPYLFGFGSDLAPEDEVIPARTQACDLAYRDVINRAMCYHASVGHPNVAGANEMAQAIISALGLA